jgi:hypothetical protein
MKRLGIFVIVFMSFHLFITLFAKEFAYVGTKKCEVCHNNEERLNQYHTWEESKHSQAYLALKSERALKVAKNRKMANPPAESEECLKCHSPLFKEAPEFKVEGVSCEYCHGPGSAYQELSIMKSKEESIKNGLTVYESVEDIKNMCTPCHYHEHFDYDAYWEKINHPREKKAEK